MSLLSSVEERSEFSSVNKTMTRYLGKMEESNQDQHSTLTHAHFSTPEPEPAGAPKWVCGRLPVGNCACTLVTNSRKPLQFVEPRPIVPKPRLELQLQLQNPSQPSLSVSPTSSRASAFAAPTRCEA